MLNEVGAISPESCSLEYLENFTTIWKITLLFYSEDFFFINIRLFRGDWSIDGPNISRSSISYTLISSRLKDPHILLNKTDFKRNKKEFSKRSLLVEGKRVSRDPGKWQVVVISDQSLGI